MTKPTLLQPKLITAILPKGIALGVVKKLREEKNILTANMNFARGTGKFALSKLGDEVVEREKEILTVLVDENNSDDLFEYIFEVADINRRHGGVMYMQTLAYSTEYMLPDIPEEIL